MLPFLFPKLGGGKGPRGFGLRMFLWERERIKANEDCGNLRQGDRSRLSPGKPFGFSISHGFSSIKPAPPTSLDSVFNISVLELLIHP